jgi:predicted nucleotidyltransferase
MATKFTELEVNSILNDFLNKVQEHISIDRAVLFGSYAKGKADIYSDIDHPEKLKNPITKDFYAEIFATGRVIR